MHVAAIDLSAPPIAHFDLPIARRCAVADHEMIREAVLHFAHTTMVVIEGPRVSLSRAAVVHDDEFPARPLHRRAPDRVDHVATEIMIICPVAAAEKPLPKTSSRWRRWRRFVALRFFDSRFLNRDIGRWRRERRGRSRRALRRRDRRQLRFAFPRNGGWRRRSALLRFFLAFLRLARGR